MVTTNKELVRRFFEELFTQGDLSCSEEIAAPTYVEHAVAPFGRDAPGAVDGRSHLRNTAQWLREQFPDVVMAIESMVEEGDLVAVRVLSHGTNLAPLNRVIPPTGRRFTAHQSHWFRIADARLAKHWATRDDPPTMIQLGVIRSPGPPGSPAN